MKVFGAYFHLMPLLYVYLPLPSSRQLTENKWRKSRFPKWEDFLQKREGREEDSAGDLLHKQLQN